MPSKTPKYVYHGHSKIISGVIAVLEIATEPLSLQELVDELTRRQLVVFNGSTPRNTVSGEISKLLTSVGPNNAPILKVNQGKLTKFFLRPRLQQQQRDVIKQVSDGKIQKKPLRSTRHSRPSTSPSASSSSSSSASSSDEQTLSERVQQRKRRQMEDLKAAYLLSCLSAHSFWLNYKNEPERDFEYFLEAHVKGRKACLAPSVGSGVMLTKNSAGNTAVVFNSQNGYSEQEILVNGEEYNLLSL